MPVRKLTAAAILDIADARHLEHRTQAAVAEQFGVANPTVVCIERFEPPYDWLRFVYNNRATIAALHQEIEELQQQLARRKE